MLGKTEETFLTESNSETQKVGETFAKKIYNGGVVLLYGNLGAGKTTFVQGLAKGLGVQKRIISPTFVIVRTYTLPNTNFYHIDLYRLQGNLHELEEIGLIDLFRDSKQVIAIEWPEKMDKALPKKRWEVYFDTIEENQRRITIKKI